MWSIFDSSLDDSFSDLLERKDPGCEFRRATVLGAITNNRTENGTEMLMTYVRPYVNLLQMSQGDYERNLHFYRSFQSSSYRSMMFNYLNILNNNKLLFTNKTYKEQYYA